MVMAGIACMEWANVEWEWLSLRHLSAASGSARPHTEARLVTP